MPEINELIEKVKERRQLLNHLIEKNDNLLDSNIIEISRVLNTALNEYEKEISKKSNIEK